MPLRINGEAFWPADSQVQRDTVAFSFEVEGRVSAEARLTELDEIDPAGRYRLKVSGDRLRLQRAAKENWADAIDLATFSGEEVTFHVALDLTSLGGFTGMLIDTVPAELPGVVWLGEGYGPSSEPAGWFALASDDGEGEGIGYVPFWRVER